MNLSNKTITIESLTVVSHPPESTVKVGISEEILPGMFRHLETYTLKLEMVFNGFDDPVLLSAVNEMLSQTPD